jgi:hypothetical protein
MRRKKTIDNRLHVVAKARWRAEVKNWKDDVRNTLLLMKELDKGRRPTSKVVRDKPAVETE